MGLMSYGRQSSRSKRTGPAAIAPGVASRNALTAFPKTAAAVDLMSGAPSPVDQRQLDELRLRAVVKPS